MSFIHLNQNEQSCRICLENDSANNMVYPCKCSGTSKYVHKTCLNQWRTLSNNPEARTKCFECNYEYKFRNSDNQIEDNLVCDEFLRGLATNLFGFLAFNLGVICILAYFLSLFDPHRNLPKVLFGNFTSFGYSNSLDSTDSYLLWASTIYLGVIFIIALINFF